MTNDRSLGQVCNGNRKAHDTTCMGPWSSSRKSPGLSRRSFLSIAVRMERSFTGPRTGTSRCDRNMDLRSSNRRRGQLQLMMHKRAPKLGIEIRLEAAADTLHHETAQVTLASGEVYQGDIVVGAEGL